MQAEESDDIFIESVLELRHTDAVLLVFSDGKAWSLFENIGCEIVARPASKSILKNLVGSQLIQLSQNQLLNLRADKASELYKYVDKKLTYVGVEQMKLAAVAQTKQISYG